MPEISIYDPRTMGKVVERMPKVKTFIRDMFFRNVETFDTEKIDVDMKKGSRQLAPFVHRKIGGKTIANSGYITESYTPPLVAPNKITTIDDILKRAPGESLYNGMTPQQRAIKKMAEDFKELDETITRREEWMCCTTLFTGQIPIIGEGINEVIDFEFTNKEKLSSTKLWTKDGTAPIDDIERWQEIVNKKGFVNANVIIMGRLACAAFLKNKSVMEQFDNRRYELAVIKPKDLPSGAKYIGTLVKQNVDIYTYNEYFRDDWTDPSKPEDKPLVPENAVGLFSMEAIYSMYYGAVAIADEQGKVIDVVEATRVPEHWVERHPARRFLQLDSAPLSVPHEVDSWYVAEVC